MDQILLSTNQMFGKFTHVERHFFRKINARFFFFYFFGCSLANSSRQLFSWQHVGLISLRGTSSDCQQFESTSLHWKNAKNSLTFFAQGFVQNKTTSSIIPLVIRTDQTCSIDGQNPIAQSETTILKKQKSCYSINTSDYNKTSLGWLNELLNINNKKKNKKQQVHGNSTSRIRKQELFTAEYNIGCKVF